MAEAQKKYDESMKEFQAFMDDKSQSDEAIGKKIEGLINEKINRQEKIEDLQGEIGLMESRIVDKDEEIALRTQAATNLQMATAQYARQVTDLRREIFRIERRRFTIYVAKNGRCWHSCDDGRCLRHAQQVRSLEACSACTGS